MSTGDYPPGMTQYDHDKEFDGQDYEEEDEDDKAQTETKPLTAVEIQHGVIRQTLLEEIKSIDRTIELYIKKEQYYAAAHDSARREGVSWALFVLAQRFKEGKSPIVSKSDLSDVLERLDNLIGRIRTREYKAHEIQAVTKGEEKAHFDGKGEAYGWCAEKLTEIVKEL